MLVFDTICALATPPYKAALATIRLSGEKTLDILSHIIVKDVSQIKPNMAYFVKLYQDKNHPDEMIDEVVLTFYKGPKSYTGFDTVEFSTHGSMIVVEEVLDTLVKYGARRAQKGEFSAQAYFNGKMDLLKAEGINDLINATSKRAKTLATKTLSGENTKFAISLKTTLLDYMSRLEYFVENQYDDEQLDDYSGELDQIGTSLKTNILEVGEIIEKTKKANRQYQGFNVAIAGEPNVGKSTLLNALLQEDKAIVSPIPGTTRDVVEGEKEINGLLFRFKDTAGLRKTDDYVENLGIERSYKTMEKADLILLASDCGFNDIDANKEVQNIIKNKPVIKIATKRDINTSSDLADISICSTTDDLHPLIDLIMSKLDLTQKEESSFLGKREEEYLERIHSQMKQAYDAIYDTYQIDIVSDTLRTAINSINDLMGKCEGQTMEDIYQTLFSKFCLGK
ncbi:MAG: tRNA uridine-5-carboxymethylaminomethyl(34) synthesis GTPase MnmE [Bacilli bacterium]|nr:tRNA uridine-5-carboxymethylaminomethyl(34) synthesis GTPase MnmE [Bacilli bacterium]